MNATPDLDAQVAHRGVKRGDILFLRATGALEFIDSARQQARPF
jgi:hypothetical protein